MPPCACTARRGKLGLEAARLCLVLSAAIQLPLLLHVELRAPLATQPRDLTQLLSRLSQLPRAPVDGCFHQRRGRARRRVSRRTADGLEALEAERSSSSSDVELALLLLLTCKPDFGFGGGGRGGYCFGTFGFGCRSPGGACLCLWRGCPPLRFLGIPAYHRRTACE